MSLSQNIKRLRLKEKLTQEQLASALGVSAQAVSKWETSETYPDGALLAPLANQLHVSLDELFDNNSVSMADISKRIIHLIHETAQSERFSIARTIGWQIEKGLFNCRMTIDGSYNPDEMKSLQNSSYIFDNYGFTMVSNGNLPFFSVFPEPEEGYGEIFCDSEYLGEIFTALANLDTMKALNYIFKHNQDYVFEKYVLANACELKGESIDVVMNNLILLKAVCKHEININGETRTLFYTKPNHRLIALLIIARELLYSGAYSLQSDGRSTPLFK